MLTLLLAACLAAAPAPEAPASDAPSSSKLSPLALSGEARSAPQSKGAAMSLRYGSDGYGDWADSGEYGDSGDYGDEEPPRKHLLLAGWGGEAFAGGGSGRSSGFWGGEAAYVFPSLDVGVAYSQYRSLRQATRTWTPVLLTRVTQRFMTGRGVEAAFTIGLGAGRPSGWTGWYQVAIGMRVPLGPLFAAGELAFEQYDIIRLAGGLGVSF